MLNTIKAYYWLTKPGIIYGNLLTAIGGFLLASKGDIDHGLFAATIAGTALIIASGCVVNNYIDRGIDAQMARTKKRALVQGNISPISAISFAAILGSAGFVLLVLFTNTLAVIAGAVGYIGYIVLYGWTKRHSVHGTLVGTLSGSMPPVAGYVAVTDRLDAGALLLFLIMVSWQMAHFYAIAMYRFDDYKAAGLPLMPIKAGMYVTKLQIVLYIAGFAVATSVLTMLGYTGIVAQLVLGIIALLWLWRGVQGFKAADDKAWARKIFGFSLLVITIFSITISLEWVLP